MQLVNIFIFNVLGVLLFLYIFAEIERNRYMYVLSDFLSSMMDKADSHLKPLPETDANLITSKWHSEKSCEINCLLSAIGSTRFANFLL